MKSDKDKELWDLFHALIPRIGHGTLAVIVDKELQAERAKSENTKAWLLRAERHYLSHAVDMATPQQSLLMLGYIYACVHGALAGRPCPTEDDAEPVQNPA